jgi:hypothetical protein
MEAFIGTIRVNRVKQPFSGRKSGFNFKWTLV